MSFPRYPKYKDSGVVWLGDVPEHWTTLRNKAVFSEIDDRTDNEDEELLTVSHLSGVTRRAEKEVNMFMAETLVGYKRCRTGDLVINTMWAWMGALGCSPREGLVSPAYNVYRPRSISGILPAFYDFLCRIPSHRTVMKAHSTGIWESRLRLYPDAFLSLRVVLPPIEEQALIAAFLDRETAKIDGLIAEQQRLIDLLKEKRQAVISHAVTKGLNPQAPMKPSGIEWLGDVPAHWAVKKLRYLCNVQTGDRDTEHAIDDGRFPFFVRSQEVERINSMSFDCEAVLTAGDGAGVGKVFHYHKGPFDFHQRVYMMNDFREVSGKYFFYYLRENFYKVALEGGAKSTVDSLRRPMFTNFTICVPPTNEQHLIVTYIEAECDRFDVLTTEAERAIALLTERRTALISAAVTGQIDVRAWAEPTAA